MLPDREEHTSQPRWKVPECSRPMKGSSNTPAFPVETLPISNQIAAQTACENIRQDSECLRAVPAAAAFSNGKHEFDRTNPAGIALPAFPVPSPYSWHTTTAHPLFFRNDPR